MVGLTDREAGKPSSKMHFWAFSADLVQDYSVSAGDWQNISGGLGKDQAMGSPLGSMHCSFTPSEEEEAPARGPCPPSCWATARGMRDGFAVDLLCSLCCAMGSRWLMHDIEAPGKEPG